MKAFHSELREAELHQLSLAFAPLRISTGAAVDELARSIEQRGQLVPVVAVRQAQPPWILIDGYRRWAALRRCGQDLAWVELWDCDVAEALLLVLAKAQARRWTPLEEAALIRELIERFDRSQSDIARHSGRDVSWVNRRLALLEGLPEEVLEAVRAERLSSWAASRIFVPLARANAEHARALLETLARQPLSTRELSVWFERYQQANRVLREQLVEQPGLFIKAWRARQVQRQAERLALGPEGAWLADLKQLQTLSQRLCEQLPAVFEPPLSPAQRHRLESTFGHTQQQFATLVAQFQRYRCDD
jgi:ParB/RepB/Spo0J family partition protein